MTEQSTTTLEGLLRRFPAFRELGDERLRWLASRARPFHCTVGQELLRPDRMPEFCFCIVEGRGRLLHDDPGLRRPSPSYSQPAIWSAGCGGRSPCEWVMATPPVDRLQREDYELEHEPSREAVGSMPTTHPPS